VEESLRPFFGARGANFPFDSFDWPRQRPTSFSPAIATSITLLEEDNINMSSCRNAQTMSASAYPPAPAAGQSQHQYMICNQAVKGADCCCWLVISVVLVPRTDNRL